MRMDGTDLDGAVLEVLRARPPVPLRHMWGLGLVSLQCTAVGPRRSGLFVGWLGPVTHF